LVGLLTPQQGHISLNSITYFSDEKHIFVPPQERPFGYVFQDYVLFPHLSVFENVAFGLRAQHLPAREVRRRVADALQLVHLPGLDQRRPAQLSGGQQQRVAIARALALQPQLLLLDEPLSALDVQTRREVRQELRRILAKVDLTTILVTHNYLDALFFGDQILVLDHGTIVQQGDQRALREYPRSSYVAELVGVNFFRGRIERLEADATCIIHPYNGSQAVELVAVLKEHGPDERLPAIGEEAYVVVAPHSITLHETAPSGSARNIVHGEIVNLLRLGSSANDSSDGVVRVSIILDDGVSPLTAEVTEASVVRLKLHEGQSVYASFKATEASAYT
jgi:molybdate transport system ATP-binding protein